MFFADEKHCCRGIWEMAKTTTHKVLRNSEIVSAFYRENCDYTREHN